MSSSIAFPSSTPPSNPIQPIPRHLPFRRISLPASASPPVLHHRQSVASVTSLAEEPPPNSKRNSLQIQMHRSSSNLQVSPRKQRMKTTSLHNLSLSSSEDPKRRKIIQEFYVTEKAYVDGLDLVYEHFLTPIIASLETPTPLLSRGLMTSVFSNFIDIWNLHKSFLAALSTTLYPDEGDELPMPLPPLSPILLSHFPYLSLYTPFTTSFPTTLSTLAALTSPSMSPAPPPPSSSSNPTPPATYSPTFHTWLQQTERHPRCNHLHLRDYLLTIIQRTPRYLLLLKDLLTHTPPSHPEYAPLSSAFALLSRITEALNTSLARHSQTLGLLALQRNTSGLPFKMLIPGRRCLKRGRLVMVERSEAPKEREVVVFSDLVVWLAPEGVERSGLNEALGGMMEGLGEWLSGFFGEENESEPVSAVPKRVVLQRPPMQRTRSKSDADVTMASAAASSTASSASALPLTSTPVPTSTPSTPTRFKPAPTPIQPPMGPGYKRAPRTSFTSQLSLFSRQRHSTGASFNNSNMTSSTSSASASNVSKSRVSKASSAVNNKGKGRSGNKDGIEAERYVYKGHIELVDLEVVLPTILPPRPGPRPKSHPSHSSSSQPTSTPTRLSSSVVDLDAESALDTSEDPDPDLDQTPYATGTLRTSPDTCRFDLLSPLSSFSLYAASSKERDEWVECIREGKMGRMEELVGGRGWGDEESANPNAHPNRNSHPSAYGSSSAAASQTNLNPNTDMEPLSNYKSMNMSESTASFFPPGSSSLNLNLNLPSLPNNADTDVNANAESSTIPPAGDPLGDSTLGRSEGERHLRRRFVAGAVPWGLDGHVSTVDDDEDESLSSSGSEDEETKEKEAKSPTRAAFSKAKSKISQKDKDKEKKIPKKQKDKKPKSKSKSKPKPKPKREPRRALVEHFVPAIWIPDDKAEGCMRCARPFGLGFGFGVDMGLGRRRHHCRLCGRCVCAGCSDKTFYITDITAKDPASSSKPARACNECFESVFPVLDPEPEPSVSDAGGEDEGEGDDTIRAKPRPGPGPTSGSGYGRANSSSSFGSGKGTARPKSEGDFSTTIPTLPITTNASLTTEPATVPAAASASSSQGQGHTKASSHTKAHGKAGSTATAAAAANANVTANTESILRTYADTITSMTTCLLAINSPVSPHPPLVHSSSLFPTSVDPSDARGGEDKDADKNWRKGGRRAMSTAEALMAIDTTPLGFGLGKDKSKLKRMSRASVTSMNPGAGAARSGSRSGNEVDLDDSDPGAEDAEVAQTRREEEGFERGLRESMDLGLVVVGREGSFSHGHGHGLESSQGQGQGDSGESPKGSPRHSRIKMRSASSRPKSYHAILEDFENQNQDAKENETPVKIDVAAPTLKSDEEDDEDYIDEEDEYTPSTASHSASSSKRHTMVNLFSPGTSLSDASSSSYSVPASSNNSPTKHGMVTRTSYHPSGSQTKYHQHQYHHGGHGFQLGARQEDTVRRHKRFSLPAVALQTTSVVTRTQSVAGGGQGHAHPEREATMASKSSVVPGANVNANTNRLSVTGMPPKGAGASRLTAATKYQFGHGLQGMPVGGKSKRFSVVTGKGELQSQSDVGEGDGETDRRDGKQSHGLARSKAANKLSELLGKTKVAG